MFLYLLIDTSSSDGCDALDLKWSLIGLFDWSMITFHLIRWCPLHLIISDFKSTPRTGSSVRWPVFQRQKSGPEGPHKLLVISYFALHPRIGLPFRDKNALNFVNTNLIHFYWQHIPFHIWYSTFLTLWLINDHLQILAAPRLYLDSAGFLATNHLFGAKNTQQHFHFHFLGLKVPNSSITVTFCDQKYPAALSL